MPTAAAVDIGYFQQLQIGWIEPVVDAFWRGLAAGRDGRFQVDQAIIWNIQKPDGTPFGQGATFSTWRFLP